jgi:phosphoribosylaminoimidazolecarboxamide formyltransferase/IMP cyclohydrolase
MKKRAIISVSDKTGIIELGQFLQNRGYEVVSTGGTAAELEKAGVRVVNVSDITGFPECLDGRVKTLHPKVHAGILAMRSNSEHMQTLEQLNITPIDVVVINLYPFKQTISHPGVELSEAIENIDIGGPSMLRAAAKNWQDVCVLTDPSDYALFMEAEQAGKLDHDFKFKLCAKVFEHTAHYDALISNYLNRMAGIEYPEHYTATFEKQQDMRYGENPHQSAVFYREPFEQRGTLREAEQLWGKELSFNNINDANGGLALIKEFKEPCVVAVKHANPCGVGVGEDIYSAYMKAYEADSVSIFGGIVLLNRRVDLRTAEEMGKLFLEIIIAPDYDEQALEHLKAKKNLRIMKLDGLSEPVKDGVDIKKVMGGLLVQGLDLELLAGEPEVVTERAPTEEEMKKLLIGWKIVKHVKSNAIVLAGADSSVGIGPGQLNRVTALKLAVDYAGRKAEGSCMASDAFFPFSDCVEMAHKAGITAIIQPGGSIRDKESIDLCNKYSIAMVFTNMRHFRH